MGEVKRKSIIKGCKHESTSEGSVLAKNGDDLAFLACDECGTIFAWQRVKKEKDEKPAKAAPKVAEKPAPAKEEVETETVATEPAAKPTGRPTQARPKPKDSKVVPVVSGDADEGTPKDEGESKSEETPIKHSASFILNDIKVDGENAIFVVENDKGKTFEVIKESTAEKAAAVMLAKERYVAKTAIVVEYTTVDSSGLPSDGTFQNMVNITPK